MEYDVHYFEVLITKSSNYFAHLPKEGNNRSPELLAEHSALVYYYAQSIVAKHQSYNVISQLVDKSIPVNFKNKQLLAERIGILFWRAIAFHDIGKVNRSFQRKQMKNDADLLNVKHNFETKHSVISMYLFLANFWSDFLKLHLSNEETIFLCNVALYMSYSIYQHHSPALYQEQDKDRWKNEDLFALKPYISLFKFDLNDEQIEQFHSCLLQNADFDFLFDSFNSVVFREENAFSLYSLIKLNYSLLTASDYLATAHYMNNWKNKIEDFGLIDSALKDKIIFHAENSKDYNKAVYKAINSGERIGPDKFQEQSNENLNYLRKCIAMEVVKNIRANADKSLFYIEAPTGGGKTNASILALAELLRADKDNLINKVYYVFPFTTLITQTYKSLFETLELDTNEIAEIHSKAPFGKIDLNKEEIENINSEETGNYKRDYKNYLDNLFMNYPVTLLSHIKFFDVLKTNEKENNYLLHRMVNSIVIIDEIQSYSPQIWDKIVYFIVNYAKFFNMKFIVMSATLPKIGEIIDNKDLATDFVYLIKDKNKYFQNPNFCNRVQFDYSLLSIPRPERDNKSGYLLNLKNVVFEKSRAYLENNHKYFNSVFTIVEFIFKKTASEFYLMAVNENSFFDEIYLLSGTILEPRRKEIINRLKSDEYRTKKILLVTTQVVEAGIDIDMDLGFKDKSLIDSDEQLAGRINRNVKKSNCQLFIFNCDSEKSLYGNDDRYRLMNELGEDYQEILKSKDFDKLYQLIIKKIKTRNDSQYIENLSDMTDKISILDYKGVNNELKIIASQNISIFVPLSIPVDYLQSFKTELNEFKIKHDDVVSGADVWNVYVSIIKDENVDFIQNRIKMKKIQNLMSNFTFSIFPNGKDYASLVTYGCEEYGFLYLENYAEIYSFENGINTEKLKDSNFL